MRAPIAVNGQGGGVKTLNYNDQANGTPALTYTLSATGTAAGRVQRNGLADLTYGGITNLTVNTGTVGNQTVKVLSTAFPMSTTVNGGRGNNMFIVGDTTDRLQTTGLLTVNGGSGQHNLLNFRDTGTTVPATYAITPTFVDRPLGGAIATLYSNIGTLVVSGGSGGNTFLVNGLAAGTATTIAAGAGSNDIFVGSGQLFDQGDLTVDGGLRTDRRVTDRLILDDHATLTPRSYTLVGAGFSNGTAATVRYSGVTSVTLDAGGGGNRVIAANLGGLSATVNTGAGGDAVTVFGLQAAPVAVNDPSGTASLVVDEGFVTAPQSYTVTATTLSRTGAAPLTYSGLGSAQLFTAHGANTVALNSTAAGTDTQVTTGSAGNTFRMGAGPFNGTLTLNGGGTDKLDYSQRNGDVYVNLQTGEATNLTAFSGIRDVTGGGGNSILVGDGHGNTLTGGPGPGRNLLIAGGSDFSGQGDTLIGGRDEDLLIAGFTDYDTDRGSLQAIMAVWADFSSFYADRVAALTTGAGVPLLDATTVHSNGGNNVLVGNAGFDLFFANPDRDRTDADPEAEVVVPIA
jgi:hypothetical protein